MVAVCTLKLWISLRVRHNSDKFGINIISFLLKKTNKIKS